MPSMKQTAASTLVLASFASGVLAACPGAEAEDLGAFGYGFNPRFPYCGDARNLTGQVKSIASASNQTLVLWKDGTVEGFGCDPTGTACDVPATLRSVASIATYADRGIAVRTNGEVVIWGSGVFGEETVPANLGPVKAVAAGEFHNIALRVDGTVACWGSDYAGQCSPPPGLGIATAVAAGSYHSLALRVDGSVRGWSIYGNGPANLVATAIAAGGDHSMALRPNGTVVCWGGNSQGQCNVPVGLAGVVKIAAGTTHSVALASDGTVRAWGYPFGGFTKPASLGIRDVSSGGGEIYTFTPARDCNANGVLDACDVAAGAGDCNSNGIIDFCEADCNANGVPDAIEIANGTAVDRNQNAIVDSCDDPFTFYCPGGTPLPVDLILIVDNSGSMAMDLPVFCSQVLQPARAALAASFDLRVTWFDIDVGSAFCGPSQSQAFRGLELPLGMSAQDSCGGSAAIDNMEDWGIASTIMCSPYATNPAWNGWTQRPGVTIVMPLSDEAADNGDPSSDDDEAAVSALIGVARRWAVPVVPAAFPGSEAWVYSADMAHPGLMDRLANEAHGAVVDLRSLSVKNPAGNAQLAAQFEAKVRAAISTSPRRACPPPCPGDVNRDGSVNAQDLSALLAAWGGSAPAADINGDGSVGPQDLATLLASWGVCPG